MIPPRRLLAPALIAGAVVAVVIGLVGVEIYTASNKAEVAKKPTNFAVSLPTTKAGFQSLDSHIVGGSLNVSGQLKANDLQVLGGIAASDIAVSGTASVGSLTLLPGDNSPRKAGQLYVSSDGSLNYYNGTAPVTIGTRTPRVTDGVLSLQGQAGNISLNGGAGIAINGTTITNSGVTMIGGATGSVALGAGLELHGNTLTSKAIRSATSLSSDILVATDSNGNLTIGSSGSGTGGMIALAPTIIQNDSSNAASIGINKTGTGNLVQLSTGTTPVNRFVVDQTGAITTGSISFAQVTGAPTIVSSVGGASGAVTLGSGLVMVGNQLSATAAGSSITSITGTTDQVIVSGGSNAVLSLPQSIAVSSTPTFGGLTLSSALAVTSGGTGATSANGARTNLGAAASGVNNDITQLAGLTTALSVMQGGTGATTLTQNGVLVGNGVSSVSGVIAASAGQCLISTAGAPSFQTCPGSGGVASVNNLTGALTIDGVSAGSVTTAGSTITLQNATASTRGLASFNATNLTVTSGTVNTIQDIATTATPLFNGLNLTTALSVASGGTGATTASGARANIAAAASGANNDITALSGLTTALSVSQGGTGATTLTQNGVVIGQGSAGLTSVIASGAGQCLVSTAGTPTFQTCPGSGGVSSLNGATGAITITAVNPASLVTVGNTITVQDASATVKGLASFNNANLTVTNGAVNTIQDIAVSSAPSFAGLTLSSALSVTSGGTGLGSTPLAGQLLIGNGTGYSLATLTAGAGAVVTNSAGGITIAAPGSGTCPSCANQALSNLSGVALNTSLLPGVTNSIDLGSTSAAFRNGYIAGVMQVGSLDAASATALAVGTTNATAINLNQNTTIAAGKSLTLAGGNTASRPASPTTGMVYYDTTTGQLVQYNGTKWASDHSSSTKIVAASNSSQAAKDAADYIATGAGDQATINTALTAAAGGLVYLMEGTYNETAAISVPNNTTLAGAGAGTRITIPNAQNGTYNVITNSDTVTGTHVTVRDLQIDGNKANQTSGSVNGVYLNGMGGGSGSTARDGARVSGVVVRNMYGNNGISLNSSNYSTISGNSVVNASCGMWLGANSNYNTVTGNTFTGSQFYGIGVDGSSSYNTISVNTSQGNTSGIVLQNTATNNTVTGNTVSANGSRGIAVWSSSTSNSITGNVLNGSGFDIDTTSYNTYTGNAVKAPSGYGFSVQNASNNNFSGNKVIDASGTNANNAFYLVGSSSNNSITDNDISDSGCTTTCYAINISVSTAVSNYLASNHHTGSAANASTINDVGTGTIYANQPDGAGNLINKSQGGGQSIGTGAATASLTLQGGLSSTALPTPAAATLSTSGTAGVTTYGYRVSALDGLGETLASAETTISTGNATLTGTNKVNITWLPIGGAYQYKVYRSTSGGTPATTGLIATVAGNILTVSDTGLTASGAVAAVNTTGGTNFAGKIQGGSLSVAGASSLTGTVTLGAASATTGQLTFANATSAFVGTLQIASLSQNTTYTLPVASGPSDTICLQTLANCVGGVSVIGALDGSTANANGATISGATVYLQSASASFAGLVNTGAQAFAGAKTFNGSVTVAANQSLTLTGGITASRPASPTTGMVYYDTTTGQLIQYNGTKWIGDRSVSTKIVAASNSSQAAKDAADYVATGTGDQATINTALTAAAGGLVYLMEGTYSETAPISIPNNTTLAGAGAGTLITIPNAQNGTYNIITNTDTAAGVGVTVRDLRIDGNQANQTSGSMAGVYLNGMGGGTGNTAREGAKLTNLTIRGVYTAATSGAIYLSGSSNNAISGNVIEANGYAGIYLTNSSNYNTLTGNTAQGNSTAGIYLTSSSSNNTISGNTMQGNSFSGIYLNSSSSNNTISGNTTQGNGNTGIHIINSSSNNTVTGNTIQGNAGRGIDFQASSINNNVAGNKIHDNGGPSANNGIYVDASNANSITSNDITDTSCTTTCYAINISNANANANYLADNRHTGTAANSSSINDVGTGTIYANQPDGAGNLINRSQGGGQAIGTASATASFTLQGGLSSTALPTPAAATLSTSGSAGATTYGYRVSALDGLGETLASAETTIATGNATLTGTNKINISWIPVGGAYQYKIYRSTSSGTPATAGLVATVAGNISTISDTGLAASGAVAAANTTGGSNFAGKIQGGSLSVTGTSNLTGAVTLGVASATTGQLTLANAGSAFTGTIQVASLSQNTTYTLPVSSAPSDTICLQTLANCAGGGASAIGVLDGGTANANGATISGATIYLQSASASFAGLVNTSAQTFAGAKTFNSSITVATNQSLTLAGGNTASRPASPTAGTVYYDTTTNQLVQYNGTKWVSDHSSTTKIVAASNSTQAAKDAADYIATGTGDQATINTALTAAAGGLVYLMEGTYSETAPISVPNNTTLAGAGAGTLITIPNAQNGTYNIIVNTDTTTGTRVTIRDLRIDGNKANQNSGTMSGIYLTNMGGGSGNTARDGAKLTNLTIRGMYSALGNGIRLDTSSNNTITGNTTSVNGGTGIYAGNSSSYNTITGNTSQGNTYDGIDSLNSSTGNTISGNTVQGNGSYGISVFSSTYNTVTGNVIIASASNGISMSSSANYNVISNNKIHDSGGSVLNSGIYLNGSSYNSITGNDITDSSCSAGVCYAIQIAAASATANYLADNHHSGTATVPSVINDLGTGTIYANQHDDAGNLINKSQGGALTVGASSATASLTLQGGLAATALPVPTLSSTVTVTGTSGTTTYRYQVTALDGLGETTGSTIQQTTTGNANLSVVNYNTITWGAIGGAYQYRIYRCAGAGCTPALLATVGGITTSYSDKAPGSPSGAVPGANATGGASFAGAIQGSSATLSGALSVVGATNLGQLTTTGASLFKNTADSTTAFQIQKSDASVLLSADTTNMTVTIAKLTVAGDITVNGHIVTGGSTPTIATGAAACTAPALSVTGNDTAGTLTLTTGTSCSAAGTMATITFNKVFGSAPRIIFTPTTAASAGLGVYNGASSTTNFTIDTSTIPTSATTYTFNYFAAQ